MLQIRLCMQARIFNYYAFYVTKKFLIIWLTQLGHCDIFSSIFENSRTNVKCTSTNFYVCLKFLTLTSPRNNWWHLQTGEQRFADVKRISGRESELQILIKFIFYDDGTEDQMEVTASPLRRYYGINKVRKNGNKRGA